MEEFVKIPLGFILEMDDVGWMDGRDYTEEGRASRSGLNRDHCIKDYEFLKALTERTGKNIAAALVVGDWDKDNFLRGEVGFTHDPYGWDRKSEIDVAAHRACLDVLEDANVDYMIHGVLHGRYDEMGKRITEAEHLVIEKTPDGSHIRYMIPEDEFRRHLDMFFKIYNAWGLKQKIRAFVTPCGNMNSTEENTEKMAKILSEYGIRYWANRFPHFPEGTTLKVYHGVACFRWSSMRGQDRKSIPWDEMATDPDTLLEFREDNTSRPSSFHGSHWTNYLHLDPEKNLDHLEAWGRFYERQGEVFGTVLSQDLAEAVNQHFYYEFAKIDFDENCVSIDCTKVMEKALDCHKNEFFLSVKKGQEPLSCEGGEISLYEEKEGFRTYRIRHTGTQIKITF